MRRGSTFFRISVLLLGLGGIVTGCDDGSKAQSAPAAKAPAAAKADPAPAPAAESPEEAKDAPAPEAPCREVLTRKAFDDMHWHFGRLGKGSMNESERARADAAIRKAIPTVESLQEQLGEAAEVSVSCDFAESFRATEKELRALSIELLGPR
ncbi:MAG: hypothetical protein AAF799_20785 [Myxococcota bacterium]